MEQTNNQECAAAVASHQVLVQQFASAMSSELPGEGAPKQALFKFGVYVQKQIIAERVFSADVYNPPARYSVNLRPLASRIMSDFQYVLRQQNRRLSFSAYLGKDTTGENGFYALDQFYYNGLILPKSEDEPGDDFSFSLKLNDNFIIERNFKVPNFNHKAIHSLDIVERTNEWAEKVKSHILKADTRLMWEEYELVNRYNISYQDVRGLAPEKRELMLRRIHTPSSN